MYIAYMNNENWKIIYYENDKNKSEIFDYIESLNLNQKAKILSWIDILSQKGPNLPRPYSDILKDSIHELRIKITGDQVRVLYFFCYKEYIVLTHSFVKNTQKIPLKEIEKAKNIRTDFLNRFNADDLRRLYNENI